MSENEKRIFLEIFKAIKNLTNWVNMDNIEEMIAYEQGELSNEKTIELFQDLLDTGLVWQLQGHYGRTAKALLQNGLIHESTKK